MPPMTKRDGAQLPHISVWYCNPVNLNLSGSTLLEKHTSRPDSPVKPLQALLSLRAGQPLRLPRSQRSQRRELLVRRLLARRPWSQRLQVQQLQVRLPRSQRSQRRELLVRRLLARRPWSQRLQVQRLQVRLPPSQGSQRRELLVRRLLARPSWSGRPCCRLHPYPTQSSLAASPARAHVRTSPRCLPRPSCSA